MVIQEIVSYDKEIQESLNKFLFQLTGLDYRISIQTIESIISDPNSHLFLAVNEAGVHIGMITIGTYISPTGRKAWIEDVVVDPDSRGEGVGKSLTLFAIQFAKDQNADLIMLTSKPERISANILYQKVGFRQKVTNVYTMVLK